MGFGRRSILSATKDGAFCPVANQFREQRTRSCRLPVPPLILQVTKGSKEADTMSSSPSRRMKIGDFLFRRLEDAGVRQLFGVPGDAGVH